MRSDYTTMPKHDQKAPKYGFADIFKKAVLGCSDGCGNGCNCCCNEITIVSKETQENDDTN